MADNRRPRAQSRERESSFDVWIPAVVAVIAAMFMLAGVHAEEVPVAAPRAIYDAHRFDAGAMDREAAAVAIVRGVYADLTEIPEPHLGHLMAGDVVVAVLPEIHPLVAETQEAGFAAMAAPLSAPQSASASRENNLLPRLLVTLGIAALLIGALVALQRTWRRTQQPTPI